MIFRRKREREREKKKEKEKGMREGQGYEERLGMPSEHQG